MLKVDNPVIDLGILQYGVPHHFTYTLTNELGKDIPINKVQVSCNSCTKAKAPSKVKGNDSIQLQVTFTPGSVGKQHKWIDIIHDDDQKVRVEFKAIVNG